MDVIVAFGRSVDIDGDEWIDLGPMRETSANQQPPMNVTLSVSEPVSKLSSIETSDEEQPTLKETAAVWKEKALVTSNDNFESVKSDVQDQTCENKVFSKAARSKASLMAFYRERAKEMEEKHKTIFTVPTKQHNVIESGRSAHL